MEMAQLPPWKSRYVVAYWHELNPGCYRVQNTIIWLCSLYLGGRLSLVEALNSGQPGVPVCLARLQNGANTYLLAIVNFAETLSNDSGRLNFC